MQFASWLDGTSASLALKEPFWFVPVVQSIHILSVSLVLTASFFVGLRTWNMAGKDWTVTQWLDRLYPTQAWALGVLLLSGALLVLAEPVRELTNYVFQIKMAGVVIATLCSLWLGRRLRSREGDAARPIEKAACLIVLMMWLAIIFAGRWIAYV